MRPTTWACGVMTMTRDPLAQVIAASARVDEANLSWRQAVRDARAAGCTLRAIADAAGVSHQTIANVLARTD